MPLSLHAVDWESRLPSVLGPRKSRLSLFTRKQQRLLDKAREMDEVPNLSALLKGRLQLLPKKKPTAAGLPDPTGLEGVGVDQESAPSAVDEGANTEPLVTKPKKKGDKKMKAKKHAAEAQQSAPFEEGAPIEATALPDEVLEVPKKKRRKGKKRPREDFTGDQDREDTGKDLDDDQLIETVPEGQPKKKTKKIPAETDALERGNSSSDIPLERKQRREASGGVPRGGIVVSTEMAPVPGSARGGSHSECPDRVSFSYD